MKTRVDELWQMASERLTPREEIVRPTKIDPIFNCNLEMLSYLDRGDRKIIDIGCGANFFKKFKVYGVDKHPKADLQQDIGNLKVKEIGKFDNILAINSLHFKNTFSQIKKLKKIARNRTKFVITANFKTLKRNNISTKQFKHEIFKLGNINKIIDTSSQPWISKQKKKIKPHSVWYHDRKFFVTRIVEICKNNDYMNGNLRFYGEIIC